MGTIGLNRQRKEMKAFVLCISLISFIQLAISQTGRVRICDDENNIPFDSIREDFIRYRELGDTLAISGMQAEALTQYKLAYELYPFDCYVSNRISAVGNCGSCIELYDRGIELIRAFRDSQIELDTVLVCELWKAFPEKRSVIVNLLD